VSASGRGTACRALDPSPMESTMPNISGRPAHPPQPGRRSVRIQGHDYRSAGAYYVTICTFARSSILGRVIHRPNGEAHVTLSALGKVVDTCWRAIPDHWPHVQLDRYVIMPNHLHGIIVIYPSSETTHEPVAEGFGRPVSGSLPTIVRSFKAACTREGRRQLGDPNLRLWQRGYHERVIWNDDQWDQVRGYVDTNPSNWVDPERHEDY